MQQLWVVVLCTLLLHVCSFDAVKLSNALKLRLEGQQSEEEVKIWVHFTDKNKEFSKETFSLDPKTLTRRSKVRSELFDERDVEVNTDYIEEVLRVSQPSQLRVVSKWFNAISLSVNYDAIARIALLDFVRHIDLVAVQPQVPLPTSPHTSPFALSFKDVRTSINKRQTSLLYQVGQSLLQLQQIGITALHEKNITGAGVRILVADSGFYKDHESLTTTNILHEYDFVSRDNETQWQQGDSMEQDIHGTAVLSLLGCLINSQNLTTSGGRKDGVFYGAAFDSEFIIAKTEDVRSEYQREEDYLIEALEWGESLGADIASISLGYSQWYSRIDFDGATALCSRAADIAVQNGMIVVVSVGNGGASAHRAYPNPPADATLVIAVGAVDSDGIIGSFSTNGPTIDGRIKPEVCAHGVNTFVASSATPAAYTRLSGTSMATPLVAGAAALILSQHPEWTPAQVKEALLTTASQSQSPDLKCGWGIVNATAAVQTSTEVCKNNCSEPNGVCTELSGESICVCSDKWYSYDCGMKKLQCEEYCDGVCDMNNICNLLSHASAFNFADIFIWISCTLLLSIGFL